MKARLDRLRDSLMLSWVELQKRLDISESMLYFVKTGARNPSRKLMRRITELEQEAGLRPHTLAVQVVKESAAEYDANPKAKELNMLELLQDVKRIEENVVALRKRVEEAINED